MLAARDDPLLSVAEVARDLQVAVQHVAGLVAQGHLPSLDHGRLVAQGRFDVPFIRRSWVQRLHVERPQRDINVDRRHGEGPHPAALALHRLVDALEHADADTAWELSSLATRTIAGDPHGVMALWQEQLAPAVQRNLGIATSGYLISAHDAVAIRLVENPLPLSQAITRPTVMLAWGAVPFVYEQEAWRADSPLMARFDEWCDDAMGTAAPPQSSQDSPPGAQAGADADPAPSDSSSLGS